MYSINCSKKLALFTLVLFILTVLFPICQPCRATDFLSSYEILKKDYSEVVDRIIAGGASESDIEAFLIDLETTVSSYGTLTEDNFDSIMYQSFQEVIMWRKHRTVFNALLTSYGDEIDYTEKYGELHPSLMPIHDAIMEALLGGDDEEPPIEEPQDPPTDPNPPGGGGGGGSLPPKKDDPVLPPQIVITPTVPTAPVFTDISGHWAEGIIIAAYQKGLVDGMTPSQFAPQNPITRAQFAALILRALGQQSQDNSGSRFKDVSHSAWYCGVANRAAELGLLEGYSQDYFGPEDPITREQASVIINRALLYAGKGVLVAESQAESLLSTLSDQSRISPWARPGVAFCLANGIMSGRDAGLFAPGEYATRAEATAVILKVYAISTAP